MGNSFDPIIAYGSHGGAIHYSYVAPKQMFSRKKAWNLADTGGQYLEGTTDITRSVVLGEPRRRKRKLFFTLVLYDISVFMDAKVPVWLGMESI